MLGKRVITPFGTVQREWGCVSICNTACARTAEVLCTCTKTVSKSSSSSYASKRNHDHMRNMETSNQ
jgi:hypothetical protein